MLMCPPSIASVEASETYVSAAGPVTVTRHLYRPAGRSTKSICPLELRASIVSGLWTPRAVRQGTFVMAHLTPREGATLFSDLDGMQPSASPLDRLPKTLLARSERAEQAEFARLRTLLTEDDSGVDKVITRLRYRASGIRGRQREELEKALTYCRNQRWRMRYAQYRRANLPIGSWVVEATRREWRRATLISR